MKAGQRRREVEKWPWSLFQEKEMFMVLFLSLAIFFRHRMDTIPALFFPKDRESAHYSTVPPLLLLLDEKRLPGPCRTRETKCM